MFTWNTLRDIARAGTQRPDVVILDCDGISLEIIERLARDAWEVDAKVLLLLHKRNEELFDKLAEIPTNGFLILDELTSDSLDDALHRVSAGEVLLPPLFANRLLARARSGAPQRQPLPHLTPRERQALELLMEGLSNKQIARRLCISPHGVKRLVANLLAKLNCTNRTLAVSVALRDGLLTSSAEPVPTT